MVPVTMAVSSHVGDSKVLLQVGAAASYLFWHTSAKVHQACDCTDQFLAVASCRGFVRERRCKIAEFIKLAVLNKTGLN